MAEEQSSTAVLEPQESAAPASPQVFAAPSTPQPGTYATLDWRQGLSEILRGDPQYRPTLDVYPDQNTFVRDAIKWRSEVNQRVRVPGEQATPEEWQHFYKQLPGYLEKPNGYVDAITLPPLTQEGEEPAGIEWDQGLLQDIYATAHANGILPRQLQPLIDAYGRAILNAKHVAEAEEATLRRNQELELQRRFGGSVHVQAAKARNFFQRLTQDTQLGQKVWELIDASGLGNHPDMVQWAALAGDRWGEPPDLLSDGLFPMTPTQDEVQTERSKLAAVAMDESKTAEERRAAVAQLQRIEERALTLRR